MDGGQGPYAGPLRTWPEIITAAIIGDQFKLDPIAVLRSTQDEWDMRVAALDALREAVAKKPGGS
jgi:hypothetical protein